MKRLCAVFLLALLTAAEPVGAAVVYSGVQNIAIPQNFNGVYLNIVSGTTAFSQPDTWNTAPWLNPFFGGVGIANSALLMPVMTGADQIVNLPALTSIGSGSNFALGESGSATHTGPAANQFQAGLPGFIGYKWQIPGGSADYYGWLRINVNNGGAGTIIDWAYDNTAGTGIDAGIGSPIPVPEPAQACQFMLLASSGAGLLARRRRR